MTFIEQFPTVFSALNEGFLNTLLLFIVTLVGALPLGLLISFGTMSKFKPLRIVMQTLVWIIRGTPLMLQLMIIFYFPSMMLNWQVWSYFGENGRFAAAAFSFILNYACYFSEIYRGGIQGVPKGQKEAGQVLGLSKRQIFFKITLLQMVKRIVPPMSNEIITLVKDTSLARIIAFPEIIKVGEDLLGSYSENLHGLVWPLFFTGLYYLLFSGLLTLLFKHIENKLNYFKD